MFLQKCLPLNKLEGNRNCAYQAMHDGIRQYISEAKLKEMLVRIVNS